VINERTRCAAPPGGGRSFAGFTISRVSADHYFSDSPGTPLRTGDVEFSVGAQHYTLTAASGVFSAGRLDPGTAVLLRKADLPSSGTLLDLGCGYGPIACVLADRAPAATVWAVDVNTRARELAAENAARLGVADRVRVCAPEDVPGDVVFDEIWSNPPTHVGKAALHEILAQWLPRLAAGGVAWLVINRHLGGDSLHAWLVEQGWDVQRTASQKGYRVLRVTARV
jgi:16S rRNA (guanine1207-N2)-methyltransferase